MLVVYWVKILVKEFTELWVGHIVLNGDGLSLCEDLVGNTLCVLCPLTFEEVVAVAPDDIFSKQLKRFFVGFDNAQGFVCHENDVWDRLKEQLREALCFYEFVGAVLDFFFELCVVGTKLCSHLFKGVDQRAYLVMWRCGERGVKLTSGERLCGGEELSEGLDDLSGKQSDHQDEKAHHPKDQDEAVASQRIQRSERVFLGEFDEEFPVGLLQRDEHTERHDAPLVFVALWEERCTCVWGLERRG